MRSLLVSILLLLLPLTSNADTRSFSAAESRVLEAYLAYYGRPADPAGLAYWAGRLESEGGDLQSIIDAFGESEEYQLRFGSLSNTDLISNLYDQLFGRAPDEGGLAFYVGKLDSGEWSLQKISLVILDGVQGEDVAIVDNRLALSETYVNGIEEGSIYAVDAEGLSELMAAVGVSEASLSEGVSLLYTSFESVNQGTYPQLTALVSDYLSAAREQLGDLSDRIHEIDLDADGDKDLVLTAGQEGSSDSTPLVIFRNLGGDGFRKEETDNSTAVGTAVVADFNGDGYEDMFFPLYGTDAPPFAGTLDQLFVQDPASGGLIDVSVSHLPQLVGTSHAACSGDVDGDGDTDLLVTLLSRHLLYINDGQGHFTDVTQNQMPYEISAYRLLRGAPGYADNNTWKMSHTWCEMGDYDDDGDIDIVLGESISAHIPGEIKDGLARALSHPHFLLFNDGAGSFAYNPPNSWLENSTFVADQSSTVGMLSFDANGDGCTDIASNNTDYNYEMHSNVYISDCQGGFIHSFSGQLNSVEMEFTDSLEAVDLDRDGKLDLLTAYRTYNGFVRGAASSLSVWFRNIGDGDFEVTALPQAYQYQVSPAQYLSIASGAASLFSGTTATVVPAENSLLQGCYTVDSESAGFSSKSFRVDPGGRLVWINDLQITDYLIVAPIDEQGYFSARHSLEDYTVYGLFDEGGQASLRIEGDLEGDFIAVRHAEDGADTSCSNSGVIPGDVVLDNFPDLAAHRANLPEDDPDEDIPLPVESSPYRGSFVFEEEGFDSFVISDSGELLWVSDTADHGVFNFYATVLEDGSFSIESSVLQAEGQVEGDTVTLIIEGYGAGTYVGVRTDE